MGKAQRVNKITAYFNDVRSWQDLSGLVSILSENGGRQFQRHLEYAMIFQTLDPSDRRADQGWKDKLLFVDIKD